MAIISTLLLEAETESGEKYYGGRVLLDGKPVKFIPVTLSKRDAEKYLGHLNRNLVHSMQGCYNYLHYICPSGSGEKREYFNDDPNSIY